MFAFPKTSLQSRVILLVSLGMLVMIGALGASSLLAVRQSIDQALETRLALAQATADHLEYVIRENMKRLQDIAFAEGVDIEDANLEPEKKALRDTYPRSIFDDGVFLVDREGYLLYIAPYRPAIIGSNLYSYPHIRYALETGKPTVSDVYSVTPSGKAVVSIVTPLKNREGRIVGLAGGDIDLTGISIREVIQPVRLGETGYIEVVDGRGVVLGGTKPQHLLVESDHGNRLVDLIKNKRTTVGTCHSCHTAGQGKEAEVMAFAPLSTVSWGVTVRQAEWEALAPSRSLQQRFVLFSLSLLVVALLLAWGTTWSVVKPIGVLTTVAQRISAGNLSDPVPTLGGDEIGRLAQSFDAMRGKLKASLEEIQEWNRELERRVEERTQEIFRRNRELSAINAITSVVTQSLNLETILQQALDKVLELVAAEVGAIYLVNKQPMALRLVVYRGLSFKAAQAISELKSPGGSLEEAAGAGRTMIVSDITAEAGPLDPPLAEAGLCSIVGVPLKSKGEVLGMLCVASRKPSSLVSEEVPLLVSIGSQIAVAIENATLYEEIQRKEAARSELLRKVISAQEEERKRIARELHDNTSQALAALVMALDTTLAVSLNPKEVVNKLSAMKVLAVNTLDEVHEMIFDLRPAVLDDLGLLPALRWYAESRLEAVGMKVRLEVAGTEDRLPSQVETALFRVVQEAITNIIKHAEAENVVIGVEFKDSAITIDIEDDGRGFDVEAVASSTDKARGLGLLGMKERITLLDGTLNIQSEPGGGTRLAIEVPLPKEAAHEQD